MILSAVISEAEEGGLIALNPETGTTAQGDTFDEAVNNLQETTALYLEEFPMSPRKPSVITSFELSCQNDLHRPHLVRGFQALDL